MGFVQCEQQKYQNKYGYNQKCHSNTICTNDIKYHRYLFIYYYHYYFCFGLSLFFLLLRTAIVVAVAVYLLLAIWIGYLIRIRIGIWKPSFTFDKNTIHLIQIDWSDWANLIEKSIYNSIEVWGMTMIQIWYLLYRKVFPTCSFFMRWGRKCGRIRFSLFVHLCMCVCVYIISKKVIFVNLILFLWLWITHFNIYGTQRMLTNFWLLWKKYK